MWHSKFGLNKVNEVIKIFGFHFCFPYWKQDAFDKKKIAQEAISQQ